MNRGIYVIKKLWNDSGVRRMLLTLTITELVCSSLMVGVFALLGKYTPQVAVGAAVGSVLAVANFASGFSIPIWFYYNTLSKK